jgi:hypothetical protein
VTSARGVSPGDTPGRRRTAVLVAASLAAGAALAACSSSAAPSTTSTTLRPAGPGSACALVTPAQIRTTLGKPVDRPEEATMAKGTRCIYPAAKPADTVVITFQGGVTADEFGMRQVALGATNSGTTDVSGTGFSAYTFTSSTANGEITSLVTLVGSTQVAVASTASLDQEEALVKQIFAALSAQAAKAGTTTTGPASTGTSTTGP